jgi:hypothetical protein
MFIRVDTPVSDNPPADEVDARLGRRFCTGLVYSESVTPGPIDRRGAFEVTFAAPLPDIGGYWFCRRFRIARGAVGGSIFPDAPDVVEDKLLWRVEVLCLRRIDPALTGRVPDGTRPAAVGRPSFTDEFIVSTDRFAPIML